MRTIIIIPDAKRPNWQLREFPMLEKLSQWCLNNYGDMRYHCRLDTNGNYNIYFITFS